MSTVIIALGCTYFVVCCSLSTSSLNCALGVKVGLRAAVFYGFPYKLRPKPKIAPQTPLVSSAFHTASGLIKAAWAGPGYEATCKSSVHAVPWHRLCSGYATACMSSGSWLVSELDDGYIA